jgi:hypothetical protein
VILVDNPIWPAHGRLWSHLVSDFSLEELHDFALAAGLPARGFDLDHYDVPAERHDDLVARGAAPVTGGELARRLEASGLRISLAARRHAAIAGNVQPGGYPIFSRRCNTAGGWGLSGS